MIVLDTNVLSEVMRPTPDQRVIAWLDRQPRVSVWTTAVTVLEIRFGLQIMTSGKRRAALAQVIERVLEAIEWRVVPFDNAAALQAGDLMAARRRKGRTGELRDTLIAGIVLTQNATLATRNTTHFDDLSVPLINPWTA
jgi:toxin FitB